MVSNTIITTQEQIEKVFVEWKRRCESIPDDCEIVGEKWPFGDPPVMSKFFVELLHQVN